VIAGAESPVASRSPALGVVVPLCAPAIVLRASFSDLLSECLVLVFDRLDLRLGESDRTLSFPGGKGQVFRCVAWHGLLSGCALVPRPRDDLFNCCVSVLARVVIDQSGSLIDVREYSRTASSQT